MLFQSLAGESEKTAMKIQWARPCPAAGRRDREQARPYLLWTTSNYKEVRMLPASRSCTRRAELHVEAAAEEELLAREDLRHARKLDRKAQKEHLDELVPRAEAGTRERQIEKKREVNEKMRSFRDKSPGAAEEVREADLMGDDGVDAYRSKKREQERKKNERELRKEEVLRVRRFF